MNMPNLASCHHFMRRMRSVSSADGAFNCVAGGSARESAGSRGAAGDARRGIAPNAVVEAAPISKSRRVIRFCFIVFTLILSLRTSGRSERSSLASETQGGRSRSRAQLENPFHELPFFSRFGLQQWLLEFRHELLPLPNLWIVPVRLCLGFERKMLIHFHDHEEARAKQVDFHVRNPGGLDAFLDVRPDFLVIPLVLRDQCRVIFQF